MPSLQNTFKFESFNDQISKIKVDIISQKDNAKSILNEAESFLLDGLEKYRELNCTLDYASFYMDLKPYTGSYNHVVYYQKNIIDIFVQHLSMNNLATESILNVLIEFARDLQADFCKYFFDLLPLLICKIKCLLIMRKSRFSAKTPPHKNQQIKEYQTDEYILTLLKALFITLAYFMKYLWRYILPDITLVFDNYKGILMDGMNVHVHRFASESFGYLARKVKDYSSLITHIMDCAKQECFNPQFSALCDGIVALFVEMIVGVNYTFHNRGLQVLDAIFQYFMAEKYVFDDVDANVKAISSEISSENYSEKISNAQNNDEKSNSHAIYNCSSTNIIISKLMSSLLTSITEPNTQPLWELFRTYINQLNINTNIHKWIYLQDTVNYLLEYYTKPYITQFNNKISQNVLAEIIKLYELINAQILSMDAKILTYQDKNLPTKECSQEFLNVSIHFQIIISDILYVTKTKNMETEMENNNDTVKNYEKMVNEILKHLSTLLYGDNNENLSTYLPYYSSLTQSKQSIFFHQKHLPNYLINVEQILPHDMEFERDCSQQHKISTVLKAFLYGTYNVIFQQGDMTKLETIYVKNDCPHILHQLLHLWQTNFETLTANNLINSNHDMISDSKNVGDLYLACMIENYLTLKILTLLQTNNDELLNLITLSKLSSIVKFGLKSLEIKNQMFENEKSDIFYESLCTLIHCMVSQLTNMSTNQFKNADDCALKSVVWSDMLSLLNKHNHYFNNSTMYLKSLHNILLLMSDLSIEINVNNDNLEGNNLKFFTLHISNYFSTLKNISIGNDDVNLNFLKLLNVITGKNLLHQNSQITEVSLQILTVLLQMNIPTEKGETHTFFKVFAELINETLLPYMLLGNSTLENFRQKIVYLNRLVFESIITRFEITPFEVQKSENNGLKQSMDKYPENYNIIKYNIYKIIFRFLIGALSRENMTPVIKHLQSIIFTYLTTSTETLLFNNTNNRNNTLSTLKTFQQHSNQNDCDSELINKTSQQRKKRRRINNDNTDLNEQKGCEKSPFWTIILQSLSDSGQDQKIALTNEEKSLTNNSLTIAINTPYYTLNINVNPEQSQTNSTINFLQSNFQIPFGSSFMNLKHCLKSTLQNQTPSSSITIKILELLTNPNKENSINIDTQNKKDKNNGSPVVKLKFSTALEKHHKDIVIAYLKFYEQEFGQKPFHDTKEQYMVAHKLLKLYLHVLQQFRNPNMYQGARVKHTLLELLTNTDSEVQTLALDALANIYKIPGLKDHSESLHRLCNEGTFRSELVMLSSENLTTTSQEVKSNNTALTENLLDVILRILYGKFHCKLTRNKANNILGRRRAILRFLTTSLNNPLNEISPVFNTEKNTNSSSQNQILLLKFIQLAWSPLFNDANIGENYIQNIILNPAINEKMILGFFGFLSICLTQLGHQLSFMAGEMFDRMLAVLNKFKCPDLKNNLDENVTNSNNKNDLVLKKDDKSVESFPENNVEKLIRKSFLSLLIKFFRVFGSTYHLTPQQRNLLFESALSEQIHKLSQDAISGVSLTLKLLHLWSSIPNTQHLLFYSMENLQSSDVNISFNYSQTPIHFIVICLSQITNLNAKCEDIMLAILNNIFCGQNNELLEQFYTHSLSDMEIYFTNCKIFSYDTINTNNDCIENDEKCAITPTKLTSVTSKTLILTLAENLMRIAPQKDMDENLIFLEIFSSFSQHMDFKTKLFNFLICQCTKLRDKSNDVTYLVNPWDWSSYVNQNSQQELENENILQQGQNAIELKINAYKEISTGFLKHMSETLIVSTQLLQSLSGNVKNLIKSSTIIENINENEKDYKFEEDIKRIFDSIVSPIFFGNLPAIIYNTREPQTAQIVDTFCLTLVQLLQNLMEFFMPRPKKDESFDKTIYYLSHFMTDYIIPLKTMIDNSMDTALYDDTLGISQPQDSLHNCNSNSIKNDDSISDNIIIPFAEIYEYFNNVSKIYYNENTVNQSFQPILCQTLLNLSCKALITTTSNTLNLTFVHHTQNKMGNLAFTCVKNYFVNTHQSQNNMNNVWIDFIIGIYDKIYTTISKHEKNEFEITSPLTTNVNRTQWIVLENEFSHRLTENLRMSDENVFGNYIHLLQALIHWNNTQNNNGSTLKNQKILKFHENLQIVQLCDMIPFIENNGQLHTAGIDLRLHNFFTMLLDIQIHEKIKAIKLLNEFIKGNLVTSNDISSLQNTLNINNFKLQPFTIKIIRVILMRNLAVAENLLQTGKRLTKDNMNIFIGLVIQTLAELCSRHLNVMHYLRILRSYITKLQTVTTKSQHFTAKPPQMSENKSKSKNKYDKTLQKAPKTTLSIATYKLYIKIIKALLDCFPNTSELVRLSRLETTDGTENFNLEHFYSLLQTSIKDLFNIFDTQSLDINSTHNAHPHAVTKEQIVKISLALPLAKFLTSLPAINEKYRKNDNKTTKFKGQSFELMPTQRIDTEYFINNLIYKLCGTLKSRAQSLREAGRDTLKQISIYLFTSFTSKQFPPNNLLSTESFMEIDYNHKNDNKIIKIEDNFNLSQEDGINLKSLTKFAKYYVLIIEHLDGLPQKGYQRNVLLYTIHVLLEEWNKYGLTKYLGLALQDLPHKNFNDLGNNKDNNRMNDEEIATNTTDFRLSKNLSTRVKCVTQKVMDIALSQIFAKQEDKISGDMITFLNDRENGGAINTELTPHLKCYENRSSVLDSKAYHTITLLVSALYSNQNFFLPAENHTYEIELLEKNDNILTPSLLLPHNILSIDQTKLLQVFAKLILAPILDFMLGKIGTNSHNVSRQNLFTSPTGVKRLKRTLEHIRQGLLLQNNNIDSKTPKNKKLSALENAKQQSTLNISHLILVHGLITGKLIQSLRDGDDTLNHKKSENKLLTNDQKISKNSSITPLYLQKSCYELDKPILIRHGQFKTEALLPEDDNMKTCMIDISGEDNHDQNSNKKLKRKLPVYFNTFCEFGLSYFLSILRNMDNNGSVSSSNEENGNCTVLAPFLPTLCDIISSNTHSTLLKISALKCCSLLFVRFGTQLYTELTTDFEHVCKTQLVPALFTILDEYGSVNVARGPIYTLVVNALKTLATLIKKYKPTTVLGLTHEHYKALLTSPYYTIDEDQLLFARFEGEAHEKRAACFVLLRALIARRIRVPELKSLMINVSRLMIYSDIEIMRESARQLYLKYIMVYSGYGVRVPSNNNNNTSSCLNEEYIPRIVSQRFNLRAQIQFICSNLSFGAVNGRLSLYTFLQALIHRLPITAFISQTWDDFNDNHGENMNYNEKNNSSLNQSFATNTFTDEQRRAHHHQSKRKRGGKKRKKPDSNTVCIELLYLSLMARIPHETDPKCLDMLWNIVRTLFAKLAFAQESILSTTTQLNNMSFGNNSMLTPSGKKSNKLSKYQAIVMELVKLALVWATFNKDTKKDNLQILGTDIISAYLQLFIEVSDTNTNSTIDVSNDKQPSYIKNNQLLSLIIPKSMINDIIDITSENLTYALTQSYELKLRIEEELLNCPDFDHNYINNEELQSGNYVGENDGIQSLLNDCKNNVDNNWTLVGSTEQPFPKHESLVKKESIIHELQSQQKLYDKFIFSTLTAINSLSQCSTAQIYNNIFESFISRKNKKSNTTTQHFLQYIFSILETNSQTKLSTYLLQHTHHWIRKLVHCVWANVLSYSRIPHLVIRAMEYTNSEEFNQSLIQNNATPKGAKMKSVSKNSVFVKNTDSFLLHFIRNHILCANVNQIQRLADSFFLHFRSPYIDLEFLKLLSPNLAFIGSCLFASEYGRPFSKEVVKITQNSNGINFSYSEETDRYNVHLPPFFWFLRKMNREYVYEAKMGGHRQFEKRMILIQTMNTIMSDLYHGIITKNSTPVKAESQSSETKPSIPCLQDRFRLEIENLSELLGLNSNKNSGNNETKKINYSTFKELFTTVNGSVITNTTSPSHIPQYSFSFFIFSLLRWLARSEKMVQIITSEKNCFEIGPPRTNGSEHPSSMMMISNVNIMALVSEFTSDIKHCQDLIKSLFSYFTNSDALYDKCTFCVDKLILEVRRKAKTEKVKQVLANPQNASLRKARKNIKKRESKKKKLLAIKMKPTLKKLNKKR